VTTKKGNMSDITKWTPEIDRAVNSCVRTMPSEQKDDLRQECFLLLLQKQEAIAVVEAQGEDEARGYVFRIAKNCCLNMLRKNKREDRVFVDITDSRNGGRKDITARGILS
jgi:DNA-directed RNA polymerase specialized sigma24 family protein